MNITVRGIGREILRLAPLLGLAGYVLVGDDSRHVVIFGTAIIFLAVAISHIVRRIIFPYIDLRKFVKEVLEQNSIASAMVLCGFIYLFTSITQALVTLLK